MSLHRNRFYEDVVDEPPSNKLNARIAALEATVARLTAPVTEEEAREFGRVWLANLGISDNEDAAALTAFLERRMRP